MKVTSTFAFLFLSAVAFAHHGAHDSSSQGGGQLTTSPDSLLSGKAWVGLRISSTGFDRRSDRRIIEENLEGDELHGVRRITVYSLDAAYGITDLFSAGLSLPYVEIDGFREFHHEEGEEEEHEEEHDPFAGGLDDLDPDGFGDLLVWAHLTLVRSEFRFGIRLGIEIPTGDTHEREGGVENDRLEASHQPGSGSIDFLLAAAVGYGGDGWSIDAALSSKINTRGTAKYEIGDTVRISVGGSVAILDNDPLRLEVTLDVWEEWSGRDTDEGRGIEESSGFVGYAAPGLRLIVSSFVVQLAVPIQFHNGIDDEPDERWGAVFSVGIKF